MDAPTPAIATLQGAPRDPSLVLRFPIRGTHPVTGALLMDWVRALPGSRFDPATAAWVVTCAGPRPQHALTGAGFTILGFGEGEFTGVTSLDQLYEPVSLLSADGRTVLVRHRLAGYEKCVELIGPGATWVKGRRLFKLPVCDVLTAGQPKPGVVWDASAIDAAYLVHASTPAMAGVEAEAGRLALAPDRVSVEADVAVVASRVGHYPSWWQMPPMAHQIPAALAVAAGHTLLADEPGVGKTAAALLAAAVTGARRVFIACPPLVVTHWAREVARTGIADPDQIVTVQAGRKQPVLDDARVVVVPDSLLSSRPALVEAVIGWDPQVVIADEAHRFKTLTSKRTEALLGLRARLPQARAVAITGTPVLAGPQELVPLLEFTGHLAPIFGGAGAFLSRYCRQDRFGGWHADKRFAPELNRKLAQHVWVRRTKAQVLPNLPEATVDRLDVTVDLADYRATHQDILTRIDEWIARHVDTTGSVPGDHDIDEYVDTAIQFASWLRRAAGMTKVPTVVEMVRDHLSATTVDGVCTRPVLVWAHHHEVADALSSALGAPGIRGGTSRGDADTLIDGFQAGRVPVLICSITAVGAGVTLTRGSDAIFAEMDWTPALMQQAIDRCVLEGQVVQTIDGPVPIEQIGIGDRVLTSAGIWGKVSDVWRSTTSVGGPNGPWTRKLLTRLEYAGSYEPLTVTHDHDVLVKRGRDGTVGYLPAHKVLPGDLLATPRMKFADNPLDELAFPEAHRHMTAADIAAQNRCLQCGSAQVVARNLCNSHYRTFVADYRATNGPDSPLPPFLRRRGGGGYVPAPRTIKIDEDWMFVCGWYLAEGCAATQRNKGNFLSFTLHEREQPIADRLREYFKRLGYRSSISRPSGSRGIELRIFSRDFASWFHAMFGHGARAKRIPGWVFECSRTRIEELLAAYLDGDGHLSPGSGQIAPRWQSKTASDHLAFQFALLQAALGHRVSMYRTHAKDLTIGKYYVHSGEHWQCEYTPSLANDDDKYVWRKVTSVATTYAPRRLRVWDLTVEGDPSYVVGLASVHNCRRIGQKNAITVRIPVASGTLDEHIAGVLSEKALTIGAITGDTGATLFTDTDDSDRLTPAKLVRQMVEARLEHHAGRLRRDRVAA